MPIPIQGRFYPFVIFLIFSFLTGFDIFVLISGILAGYLDVFKITTRCYDLSRQQVGKCETNCLFSWLRGLPGYYSVEMAEEYLQSDGDLMPRYDRRESINRFVSRNLPKEDPFKGDGVMIGKEVSRPVSRLVAEHEGVLTREDSKSTINSNDN